MGNEGVVVKRTSCKKKSEKSNSSNQGRLRQESRLVMNPTAENQNTTSALRESAQAGEAIIDFEGAKTKFSRYYKPAHAANTKVRLQNMNEIELKSNSEISNLLESSIHSKNKMFNKQNGKHLSKIHLFEHEFQKSPRIEEMGKS